MIWALFATVIVSSVVKLRNDFIIAQVTDEIFHIPQLQLYCKYNFSYWNPKITTFPGLYYTSFAIIQFLKLFSNKINFCSDNSIRYLNVVYFVITFYVYRKLARRIIQGSTSELSLYTFTIVFNPFLLLYSIVYYTDLYSLMTVFCYLLYNKRHSSNRWINFLIGLLMILSRQTNVVWVVFILGYRFIVNFCRNAVLELDKDDNENEMSYMFNIGNMVISNIKIFKSCIIHTLKTSKDILFTLIIFMIFVILNRGLVLGDREAHKPGFHMTQLFYFCFICNILTPFRAIFQLKPFFKQLFIKPRTNIVCLLFIVYCIYRYTIIHQYIIADNSTIRFYIYRRILSKQFFKYGLSLLYLYSFYSCWTQISLFSHNLANIMMRLLFFLCACLTLIPAPMIEFRYYIVLYSVWRLLTINKFNRRMNRLAIISELWFCLIGNVFILFLFFYKPVHWPDGEVRRFLW